MNFKLQRPKFNSDKEESEWWYANRDQVSDEAVRAFETGKVRRTQPMPPGDVPPGEEIAAIPMNAKDSETARSVASKRGVSYETYLKTLLHEAVQRDGDAA